MLKHDKSIALVVNTARAIEHFRGPLIHAILAEGKRVFVFAPDYTAEIEKSVGEMGAEPVRYRLDRAGTNPIKEICSIVSLFNSLRASRPDAVFAFQLKAIIYVSLATRWVRGDQRYGMIEGLGSYFTDEGSRSTRLKRVVRWLGTSMLGQALQRMDRVFTLNGGDTEFVRALNMPSERVVELEGIGVDLDEWAWQRPWTNPPTFTFIGRFIKHKGVLDFVEAAKVVQRGVSDSRFVILGHLDSNVSAISRDVVEGWVENGIVEWPGHVDVKPWLAQTSVFVLPSYYREGKPRSTQEAMAMGRPIITTDVPGCRETVFDGVNGFLVPPRDPVALAEAMQRFIEQPELIAKMGAESRRIAEEKYDVHKVNRVMLDAMVL